MEEAEPEDVLSWENLIYIADLLEVANEHHVSLLGGEPTLHPHFVDFAIYLLERNFHITVFTSGILSDKKLDEAFGCLADVHRDSLSFVANLNHPGISTPREQEKIDRFLRAFGPITSVGFNIYNPDFDIDFILHAINGYGLRRHIRVSIAHPIPGEVNSFIAPGDFAKVSRRLIEYAPILQRMRISMGFDCGMPMCLFTDQELGILYKVSNGTLRCGCGPAIDIGPDMKVWSCFPLSNFQKKSLFEFNSFMDVRHFYEQMHDKVRFESGGVYEKCDTCAYRETGLCRGGCLAHILSSFIDEKEIRPKEMYS